MPGHDDGALPSDLRPIAAVYNPALRRRDWPLFHYLYLHRTARNLAAALAAVHARGAVAAGSGSWNEADVRVADTALVFLVGDTPAGGLRAVANPELAAPELQGRPAGTVPPTAEQDLFVLGVLVFRLLMEGYHPFAGTYTGPAAAPPEIGERIAAGHFPYGTWTQPFQPPRTAPPFGLLAPNLQALFLACFEAGYRDPLKRPTAVAWEAALAEAEAELVTCPLHPQHLYGRHLAACPWCERTVAMAGRDPFPDPPAMAPPPAVAPSGPGPGPAVRRPPPPSAAGVEGDRVAPPPRPLLWGGGLLLVLLLALVYSKTRHTPVLPPPGPFKETHAATPQWGVREVQGGLSTAHLEGRLQSADPTGCDEASLLRVQTLTRLGPVRRGEYALEQPLQQELSRALRAGGDLNRPCVDAYLAGLAAQQPGLWHDSPFSRDGMAKLVDLIARFNVAGKSPGPANDPTSMHLVSNLRPLVCRKNEFCEIQLVGETLVIDSPVEILMYAHTRSRRYSSEGFSDNGVHLTFQWTGDDWEFLHAGQSPFRPEYR